MLFNILYTCVDSSKTKEMMIAGWEGEGKGRERKWREQRRQADASATGGSHRRRLHSSLPPCLRQGRLFTPAHIRLTGPQASGTLRSQPPSSLGNARATGTSQILLGFYVGSEDLHLGFHAFVTHA